MSAQVDLVHRAFDPAELLEAFHRGADDVGAVVSFTGFARGKAREGAPVAALVLESYRGVTLRSMEAIAAEALDRFDIASCRVVHRDGTILPGEAIVFVATAARHRRAAFEAADYLMDRLKTEAVFWKREEGPGGGRWIEPTDADRADAGRWA
ncbi:molybdenum cofactor biosynthesis protein MoaE [Tsuneonella sp. YG55]|uniref:Molybdopterin synthase catalytic subunit n=1 Tax=Tsuneonella litorea TaxID=2976475 RepID=A0A9X2W0P5_9SPHN|nr:molybdenum cofactor biosynthesis protein MoaE [Tsuneonella litorea]MCT2558965.1 molybdenum cofactor biosynthesis protein MoaE [Tsuneonella litorea]